jgi:hypothetical protein
LVDVNVLIYAINTDSAHHKKAKRWLEGALSGTELVGMAWIVVLAFLRITTRRGFMDKPLSTPAAVAFIDSWLGQPNVELVVPGESHWMILRTLIASAGTAGNLTSDAHLAALAIEGGWTLVSTDHDFRRFAGLRFLNPLE